MIPIFRLCYAGNKNTQIITKLILIDFFVAFTRVHCAVINPSLNKRSCGIFLLFCSPMKFFVDKLYCLYWGVQKWITTFTFQLYPWYKQRFILDYVLQHRKSIKCKYVYYPNFGSQSFQTDETGGLGIRIMCPSGTTYLSAECCSSDTMKILLRLSV